MRIPIPRAPISTQNLGGFSAPSPAMPRDQGPAQLADVGQSLTVAAQGALRVGLAVQEEIDQAILTQVDTVAGEITRNTVSKFQQLAGKNAVDAYDNLQLRYRDQIAKIGDMAKTPVQKQLAARVMAERMQSGLGRLMAHRDSEARNWAIGESDAAATGAVRDYKASIGDAEKMAEARELAIRHIDENSRLKGYGPKQSKAARLAVTTDMHLGAVGALLAAGLASKAGAYLETYKGEIEPQEATKAEKVVRGKWIDQTARQLDAAVPSLGERLATVDKYTGEGMLTGDEAESAKRHLRQLETGRLEATAIEERSVRDEVEKWQRANPMLSLEDNPALAQRAQDFGVTIDRVQRTDPEFERQLQQMDIGELRSWGDARLKNFLQRGLSQSDANRWFAFVRGDQSTMRLEDSVKRTARFLGILPQEGRASESQQAAFDDWRANTVDPLIERKRGELKRDLFDAEVRKFILGPMEEDKVEVADWGAPTVTSYAKALRDKEPLESIFVPVPGKEPVRVIDMPPDLLRDMAKGFQQRYPRGVFTLDVAARMWDARGRPKSQLAIDSAEYQQAVEDARKLGFPVFSRETAIRRSAVPGITIPDQQTQRAQMDLMQRLAEQQKQGRK